MVAVFERVQTGGKVKTKRKMRSEPTVEEMKERVLSDRTLTRGQKEQALRFLAYTPGRHRGEKATDPINKLSAVQICLRYLEAIKAFKENLDNISDSSIRGTRELGGKSGIVRFRKNKQGRPVNPATDRTPLLTYVKKTITGMGPLTLDQLVALFPERNRQGLKSCVNKAVSQGRLKYNIRSRLYHL